MNDIPAVEDALRRIPGVAAVRIVADAILGHPVEVHVLAEMDKHPKQIVRDIQSVAMASFDLELDRRIISVVQLETPRPEKAGPAGVSAAAPMPGADDEPTVDLTDLHRVRVAGVGIARNGHRCTAEVALTRDGAQTMGTTEGVATPSLLPALVARAAVDALGRIDPLGDRLEVESASVQRLGSREIAVVTLLLLHASHEETLIGSAPVRAAGYEDAVVRAVLDATNRRLASAS